MSEAELRDRLALERTRLANERTLLAYIRTALALAAGGVAIFHFFPTDARLVSLGWVLVVCGIAALALGAVRFLKVKARLR